MQADRASSSAAVQSWESQFPILSELLVVGTAVGRDAASAKVLLSVRHMEFQGQNV